MDRRKQVKDFMRKKKDKAVKAAKKAADIATLKSRIATCELVKKKNYKELGKLYYELFGSDPNEYLVKQCWAIRNAKDAIIKMEDKLRHLQQE
jgi:endonuclease YncB( thermonuclease family)